MKDLIKIRDFYNLVGKDSISWFSLIFIILKIMYQSLAESPIKVYLRKTNSPTNPRLSREVNFIFKRLFYYIYT